MNEVKTYEPDDIPKTEKPKGEVNQPKRYETQEIYIDHRTENVYQFLIECEDGTGGFSGMTISTKNYTPKSYIVGNPTENFYKTRIKRAVYNTYFSDFLEAKYKDVFSIQEVSTTVSSSSGTTIEDHQYTFFASDVTGGGINKNEFNKNAIHSSWRDAVSFIVMDKIAEDLNPYVYVKGAAEVAKNKDGKLLIEADKKGSITGITFNEAPRYEKDKTILKRSFWGIEVFANLESSDDGESWQVVEEVSNTLRYKGKPFLPVKPLYSQTRKNNKDFLPVPKSYKVASLALAIYDRGSVYDYLIDKQGHSILVINGSTNGVGNGRDNALIVDTMENKAFQPFFMSPDAKLAEVHSNRINELKEEMFQIMDNQGVSAAPRSVTQESGVSKAYTFSAKASTSKSSLRMAMELDRFLEMGYKAYTNDNQDWESVTSYPTEFAPQMEVGYVELEAAADFFNSRGLKENEASVVKKYIQKLHPNAKPDEIEELYQEIDNLSPVE